MTIRQGCLLIKGANEMLFTLQQLQRLTIANRTHINGEWVPARPTCATGVIALVRRIKAAVLVIRGKADAVTWPQGQ